MIFSMIWKVNTLLKITMYKLYYLIVNEGDFTKVTNII